MHVKHHQDKIKAFVFEEFIWGIYPVNENGSFIVEIRNEEHKSVELKLLNTCSKSLTDFGYQADWWEKIMFFNDDHLYSVKYPEKNNPSKYSVYVFDSLKSESKEINYLPESILSIENPSVYEHGSEYHKMVNDFLGYEQPLGCEYLEFKNYIIISYYIRLEKGFDRILLCLKEGKKVWKLKQDSEMKGMALGSFFVINEQLIFVKDRNEVCCCDL